MSNIYSIAPNRSFLVRSILFTGLLFLMLTFAAQAQTINELSYTGAWGNKSLQGTQGGSFGGIAAFITTPNNQMHVYYSGVDQNIHQRYPNGSGIWVDEDLTYETHAGPTGPYTYVTGFSLQNFQYVFYADVNGHIHQMLYNNSNWSDSDITALGGGAALAAPDTLFAMTTTPNNQIHVYYGSTTPNGQLDLHQLFFNGSRWSDTDLTIAGGGIGLQLGSTIGGVTIGNYQYVFYEDVNYDIHEMYYNNVRWTDLNLAVTAGASQGAPANLAALVIPGTQTIKLYYPEWSSFDMIELTTSNNTKWSALDLTRVANGSSAVVTQVVAFVTTPNNQIHLYYGSQSWGGGGGNVYQYFFNGSRWSYEDLSAESHSAGNSWDSGMAGFAIGNSQYIFYGQ